MWIYWFIFILLIYYGSKTQRSFVSNRAKNKYIMLFFWFFVFLYSLRSYAVGTDTMGYLFTVFPRIDIFSFKEILITQRDPIFFIILKFVRKYISTLNIVWFTIIAFAFWVPVFYVLKKNSVNIFISLLVMMLFRYSDFPLNAMRNGIAVGLVFLSIHFLVRKKFKHFLLFVILAALFHKSALIILLLFPFIYIDLLKYKRFVFLLLFIVLVFRNLLYSSLFVNIITFDEEYSMYTNIDSNITKILTYLIVLIFFTASTLFLKGIRKNESLNLFYASTFLSLLFATISLVNPAFERISLYFGMGFLITIPYVVDVLLKKYRFNNVYTFVVLFFSLIYIFGGPAPGVLPYSFFWNPKKNSTHLMDNSRAMNNQNVILIYQNDKLPIIP